MAHNKRVSVITV